MNNKFQECKKVPHSKDIVIINDKKVKLNSYDIKQCDNTCNDFLNCNASIVNKGKR